MSRYEKINYEELENMAINGGADKPYPTFTIEYLNPLCNALPVSVRQTIRGDCKSQKMCDLVPIVVPFPVAEKPIKP